MAQESRLVDGNTLILDIVAIRDQRAVIIEPTIVYENTPTSLQQGNSEIPTIVRCNQRRTWRQ